MEHYYITIGRQHGCGGRLIGKELADRLGIAYYDRDTITDMIAEDCGLSPEAVSGLMERRTSSLLYEMATLGQTNPLEEQVFISKTRIVNRLADQGSFVIVGICADYILRDRKNLLKVFLYGDPVERMDRIVNVYHDYDYLSEQKLKALDRNRADYYRFFTSYKWGNRANYDILINTDVGLEGVTDMLELIAKKRFGG
ncbi:MAG: cytidylate kinase-like family protein [Clostridia bacterium]|nr:cytidylate kinase-like family protein [Clostridia bacterium]